MYLSLLLLSFSVDFEQGFLVLDFLQLLSQDILLSGLLDLPALIELALVLGHQHDLGLLLDFERTLKQHKYLPVAGSSSLSHLLWAIPHYRS